MVDRRVGIVFFVLSCVSKKRIDIYLLVTLLSEVFVCFPFTIGVLFRLYTYSKHITEKVICIAWVVALSVALSWYHSF